MRAAIAAAEVGDEQRGEDPTVNELLRARARADRQGGGALPPRRDDGQHHRRRRPHADRRAVLAHRDAHLLRSESAGPVGARPRADGGARRADRRGRRAPRREGLALRAARRAAVRRADPQLRGRDGHGARPAARAGRGRPADPHGRRAAAQRRRRERRDRAAAYCAHVDSVWLCFTKGLGAPIGAVLAGDAAFIAQRAPAQAHGRRRAAPGRDRGGRLPLRARPPRRAAGRGSRQRATARARPRAARHRDARAGDQHGLLPGAVGGLRRRARAARRAHRTGG